ncbi:GreA/GreB family elongation factor [Gaoshiqia sp. Z1-71]|uniref:GreA/GreB family elongation factor n=1 Tax=Gaoshiqia hydrogeniformans TaxID=3290090 RepID=UPI003BF8A1BC
MFVPVTDFNELMKRIRIVERRYSTSFRYISRLKANLMAADQIRPCEVPRDLVTMNSFVQLHRTEPIAMDFCIQLVYPEYANVRETKVSVFSELGVAVFLKCIGDELSYDTWKTNNRLLITGIPFQPEVNAYR